MKSDNLFLSLLVIGLVLLSGCVGKHNIPSGPTMDLVAIKYDAAWLLGDGFAVHGGAEKGFREVLELAPAFAEAHYNLGIALSHQSRWIEASSEFNRALLITPDFEMARVARDLAQRVLNDEQQSTEIQIPRYCRIFHELYELGC